ncbi:receptor-like protein kinase FERONIA [Senna tora]|uniref:Receptor-like protein kinase FERONIA n=1 Tax=Senna tora TaxID=362788 RepID=A0A834WH04_9FABA|nr:receptor-like protein kinase FERONIA [Senna tora]
MVSFLFLFLLSTIPVLTSYTPTDFFSVNCGSSAKSPASDHRNWTGDIASKLFSPIDEPHNTTHPSSVVATAPTSLELPYSTARLSRSQFTYSFPVLTAGQKFLRLYFFPSSYPDDFHRSDSLFSVKAGPHTLLKDFNASLAADDTQQTTLFREYCVHVQPRDRKLNVTFTPSNSASHPNAYAFINGIEVVSMPTYLYYTNPQETEPMNLNGGISQISVENTTALETSYRINVGGSQIAPDKDTGMFRYWDEDVRYLEREYPQSTPAGFGFKPIYKNFPNYTAPDDVYLTARTYGMTMNEISMSVYNVTWQFRVDSEFTYMVRLHFCEFEQEIQNVGDRVFQIFIDDTLVEPHADVITWSHANLVPVYKDYAVMNLKKMNLSIKLRPLPNRRLTSYRDVILNGIEIFKMSDGSDNLGGPNPDPPRRLPDPSLSSMNTSKKKTTVVFIVVGVASGCFVVILISLITWLIFCRVSPRWGQNEKSIAKNALSSSLPSDLCRCFSIAEIRAATNNFDDVLIVGVGGFGNVYKGYIDNGTVPVAIKRLKPGSQQGAHEFQTEIEMLSQLRHLHLVSLIGYCNDNNEMILVYEFMARGTLRDHLYNYNNNNSDHNNKPVLSWKQRLEMCLGAARGLHYLHTGANHNIIHRDVKTTNILIDEKWIAKVSDFGLSKVGPTGMSTSHVSTVVKGSVGYLDPEYYKRQRLTQKSDVYSFGVVLLEVLCGRPPLVRTVEKRKASLVEWVRRSHREGVIEETIDRTVMESVTPECLKAFSEMALKCLEDDGNGRPCMNDVVWGLEFALEIQESTEEIMRGFGGALMIKGEGGKKVKEEEEESNYVGFTSSDGTVDESKSSKVTMTTLSNSWEMMKSEKNISTRNNGSWEDDDEASLSLVNPHLSRMLLDISKLRTSGTTNQNKPAVACPLGVSQLYTTCLGLNNNDPNKPYCDPRNRDPTCQ